MYTTDLYLLQIAENGKMRHEIDNRQAQIKTHGAKDKWVKQTKRSILTIHAKTSFVNWKTYVILDHEWTLFYNLYKYTRVS